MNHKWLETANLIAIDYGAGCHIYEKDGKYYRILLDDYGYLLFSTSVEVFPAMVVKYAYFSEKEFKTLKNKNIRRLCSTCRAKEGKEKYDRLWCAL